MFSYPTADEVIDDLGDKVVGAITDANQAARADLAEYRGVFPQWVADHTDRGLSNWIHDRLWVHLRRGLTDVDSIELADDGIKREVFVGSRYRARVKRHSNGSRIRSYPTRAAAAFWTQTDTLEGMEEVRLGFGYRWDPEERAIGNAIVSLRDGLDKDAIWVVEFDPGAGEAGVPIGWTPIEPTLPQIDLYEAAVEDEEEAP